MKLKWKRLLLLVAMFVAVMCSTGGVIQANALTVEGSSSSGGTGGKTASGGYAVHASSDDCVGYRFTVVNAAGEVQDDSTIDIYRSSSTYGSTAYTSYKLFSTNCKSQWITDYSSMSSYSSVDTLPKNDSSSYKDSSLGLTLPAPSGIVAYLEEEDNTKAILAKMGLSLDSIGSGCMLICEPLFGVSLKSTYYVMTVTDMAVYGYICYNKSSTAPKSTAQTDGTFAYIARYTNNIYPNLLYTENGYGLWSNASALSYTSSTSYTMVSYKDLITKGYGVCIAYGNNTYTVTYKYVWPDGSGAKKNKNPQNGAFCGFLWSYRSESNRQPSHYE